MQALSRSPAHQTHLCLWALSGPSALWRVDLGGEWEDQVQGCSYGPKETGERLDKDAPWPWRNLRDTGLGGELDVGVRGTKTGPQVSGRSHPVR